jgi:hypothetical protein
VARARAGDAYGRTEGEDLILMRSNASSDFDVVDVALCRAKHAQIMKLTRTYMTSQLRSVV